MAHPYVIEKTGNSERAYDIYSRLLEDRVIMIGDSITDSLANSVVLQLLLLDSKDNKRITVYINSPGGSVTAGMAIIDTMNYIKSEVMTVCVGCAASMGALLLASGTKGKRYALPNSRIMIHEPLQTFSSPITMSTTDQEIDTNLLKDMRRQCIDILVEATGQKRTKVKRDCERDKWLTAKDAEDYGIVDSIIEHKP